MIKNSVLFFWRIDACKNELDYCNSCINIMKNHINKELQSITEEYQSLSNNTIDNIDESNYIEDYFAEQYIQYEPITLTFIEALLVRQVALMENLIVVLSKNVYHHLYDSSNKNRLLRPDEKITKDKHFTDAIRAVEYINEHTQINLKLCSEWEVFSKMRELRHRFAHGVSVLHIDDVEAKSLNKLVKSKTLLINRGGYYTLNENFDNLLDIGKRFESFINNIEVLFKAYLK